MKQQLILNNKKYLMSIELSSNQDYKIWFKAIKEKVYKLQIKAALSVNSEMLEFYWNLGKDIIEKQSTKNWGDAVVEQLGKDLQSEFPEMKGFSRRNLFYMKKWYLFYNERFEKVQQSVAQKKLPEKVNSIEFVQQVVAQIPWGHNILIITKIKDISEALFYINETIINGWSRSVLEIQIETNLYSRQGKAISNFNNTLPKPQSNLANQTLKDPYIFDILTVKKEADERDIENQLTKHITKFLLELGAGFAFVGRQYKVQLSEKDRYIDLLFYHLKLRCYVVIELKAREFEAEHTGKLALYISAIDKTLRTENDNPTIGLILCKKHDKIEAEYLLDVLKQPIGIAKYEFSKAIPNQLKSELPSIEDIEKEFSNDELNNE
jgi:predicted nuclease of restriction endonuclease-like (RecB) superfamily